MQDINNAVSGSQYRMQKNIVHRVVVVYIVADIRSREVTGHLIYEEMPRLGGRTRAAR